MNIKEIVELRHWLHKNPEISGKEEKTAKKIISFLKGCNPSNIVENIGGNGILATYDSQKNGIETLFRAELDALPIQETNLFNHQSSNAGISHKCGHDGHTSILCGLAKYLSKNPPKSGKIHLLFQPAEETGEGAKLVLNDQKFMAIKPDYVFALHNLPEYKTHEIVVKPNNFTAAVTSIIIKLDGKTAHAAEPENGKNPALAIGKIIEESQKLNNPDTEGLNFSLVTPIFIQLGEKAYGVSAGNGEIHFTLRCFSNKNLEVLKAKLENLVEKISHKQNLQFGLEYTQSFSATNNHPEALDLLIKAATNAGLITNEVTNPFKWGEDFGLFTSKFKGCFFGLGAGFNIPALHNPDYDFNDDLLDSGIEIFKELTILLHAQ